LERVVQQNNLSRCLGRNISEKSFPVTAKGIPEKISIILFKQTRGVTNPYFEVQQAGSGENILYVDLIATLRIVLKAILDSTKPLQRYIAGSSKSSNKPLSLLLTKVTSNVLCHYIRQE
jgi:hypothetical protein